MNILHINQSDIGGGAAIAGYRLHAGLLAQGIQSHLLVGSQQTNSSLVAPVPRSQRLERNLQRITRRLGLNYINYQTGANVSKHPFYQSADILNFHNLHNSYFNYLAIPELTASKPAVFTLHDMWSLTGHCAYSYNCERWKIGCGQCPDLGTYPAIALDNTKLEWKLKSRAYQRSNLAIVTPSKWLTKQAEQSMLSHFPIYHIPYGIDTNVYHPLDTEECCNILGIPKHKRVLMFGAANLSDSRKGCDLLLAALDSLPLSLKKDCLLLMLGSGGEAAAEKVGIPAVELGYVSSDRLKAAAYSAADLFLFPTRADNLPLVLQESMACGTPMVSFDIGGVSDLIRPGETGYLAKAEDTQGFCQGIIQLLEDSAQLQHMAQRCREIALAEYAAELQTKHYLRLYSGLLA